MTRRASIRFALLALATGVVLIVPAAASAAPQPPITLFVKGKKPAGVLDRMIVHGRLADPGPNKRVTIRVRNEGRKLFTKKLDPNNATGEFRMPLRITRCCRYVVLAEQGEFHSDPARFRIRVPNGIGRGARARLFHKLLKKEGYHVAGKPKRANWSTRLAILAFRKVNGMGRNTRYSKKIFKKLLQRRGGFKPRHERGRHVEVDISRQVMSLIAGGEPQHTFHVSTGASSTPTIRGKFRFYMRQPGYNSHAMYYSVYFRGGYATHGYDPVPTYPASHGCVRNPIPYSRFIYRWVRIGMPIYVYL